ncbi:hypothetical protein HOY80DRAFT_895954 [Tuber brumale]|nr:hypothetical protein HOY80DRAFT_895954 [Tuber brumale]
MHLPAAAPTIPLFDLLSLVANVPEQTSENSFTNPLKGDLMGCGQLVNLTRNATTKNHKPSQGRSQESRRPGHNCRMVG